jgi:CxC2 like cysteine cluster associated with KDZ transposases
MISAHSHTPTHSIRTWNNCFWEDSSLSQLGLVVNLGHQGAVCPKAPLPSNLWIGDSNGFNTVAVRFCSCVATPSGPLGIQLLQLNIFPCSNSNPESGFTIQLLRQFGVFSTLGKGSAHKFYAILERLTKPGFPSTLPNRSRELLLTHRRFSFLLAQKRSGLSYPPAPNPAIEDRLSIRCPACPNPGMNFNEDELTASEK